MVTRGVPPLRASGGDWVRIALGWLAGIALAFGGARCAPIEPREPKTDAQKDREHKRSLEEINARAEAFAKARCMK